MRSDGFERMDVSTSIDDDPKFRILARRYPELVATAGWAYIGLLARSWREGERLTLEEGWPSLMPFDQATVDAMQQVGLIDGDTRLPEKPWRAWYGAAAERRHQGRERQHRADIKRGRVSPSLHPSPSPSVRPSGSTGSPSVSPSDSQSGPTSDQPRSNVGAIETCDECGRPTRLHAPKCRAGRAA